MINKIQPKLLKGFRILTETLKSIFFQKSIPVLGIGGMNNFGDALNIPLIQELTGRKVVKARYSLVEKIKSKYNKGVNYSIIGSILQWCKKNTVIWGAGLLSEDQVITNFPKKICAVRGPLTRNILISKGIECPEVYGDPGLLLPLFYQPTIKTAKYKLGIIPHYVDQTNPWLKKWEKNNDILIINILTTDWQKVVNQAASCEKIISSSLHGIIVADSYKIPSLWVEFSDKVMGNGFKFKDYFTSVGKPVHSPVKIHSETTLNHLYPMFTNWVLDFNYTKLLQSCPFKINYQKLPFYNP